MFSVLKKNENGFEIVELRDESSGTIASIIASCGAMLHGFTVHHDGSSVNVIDNGMEDLTNIEAAGFKSCKLSPFVCRMKDGRYHFGQAGYQVEKFYLAQHAIHGLIYDATFSLEHKHADALSARVVLKYEYKGEDKGYPFLYDCLVKYELFEYNRLSIHTQVTNRDPGYIPVSDGWHPYFSFGGKIDDLQLEFQSKEIVEFDEGLVPTGKLTPYQEFGSLKKIGATELDNCFTANFAECQPMLVLRDPSKKMQLEIIPEKSYPYLQIYTPPHRKSIAIENLSSAPDAFNNGMGLITLPPGECADFVTTYQVRSFD
jgi:aldose 1-epimerase